MLFRVLEAVTFLSHLKLLLFPVCETRTVKVLAASTEENVQPFKDKMENFLGSGKFVI
jgi:hypothetical protein